MVGWEEHVSGASAAVAQENKAEKVDTATPTQNPEEKGAAALKSETGRSAAPPQEQGGGTMYAHCIIASTAVGPQQREAGRD